MFKIIIVSAYIIFVYIAYVIHISNKEKRTNSKHKTGTTMAYIVWLPTIIAFTWAVIRLILE